MIISDNLTEEARATLDRAHRLLGHNLSGLLLSGLGETQIAHGRTFTARRKPEKGEETTYQLEMTNNSKQGLPIGTDPLVMAYLLNLLHEEMRMADTVECSADDVLKALGWSDDSDSLLNAVERYALTNYCLISHTASDEETLDRFQSLLISYEMASRPHPAKTSSPQILLEVRFFPAFIYSVFTERKSFLGIDFNQLQEIREIRQ